MPQADAAGAGPLGAGTGPRRARRRDRRAAADGREVRRRSRLPPVRAPRWLPTPARRRARAASATLRRTRRRHPAGVPRRPDPRRTAGARADRATDPETGRPLSDDEIRHELVVFMVAGHDTTATTLTYALWALGPSSRYAGPGRRRGRRSGRSRLTPEDVPRLGYTVQVLHEALRLCPPAAGDIPDGRCRTSTSTATGSRPAPWCWWGSTPCTAIPPCGTTRWCSTPTDSARQNSKDRDRWQYLPFGAGPRSCIGDHFAMLEATLALATIIRRTEIQSLDADFPLAVPFTIVAAAPIRADLRLRM